MFDLSFTATAEAEYQRLKIDPNLAQRFKAVKRCLERLAQNPRHQSLNTHEWRSRPCPHGGKLWEAYAQNNTPGAYRVFFCYDPDEQKRILIVAITPHP